jgi:hypothetical protein
MISKTCITESQRKIETLCEKRSKFELKNLNQKKIEIIQVDGCAITDGIRCDYLIRNGNQEIYVELKGHDVCHAKKQIERSISLLSACQKTYPKISYIISTRNPIHSPQVQKWQLEFKKK